MAETNVVITKVFYKGIVERTQSDEYVEIANWGAASADLSGWHLHDSGAHNRFTFPDGTVLAPRKRFRVYTNEIHPETGGFSFKRNLSVWNDAGDTATLVDAEGQPVSTWTYPGDEERHEPPVPWETFTQQFYVDALKKAIDSDEGSGRDFVGNLGERVEETTAPQSVQSAYGFYKTNVEEADWGSVTVYKVPVGSSSTYAVHVTTDGDDGWLEIYSEAGDELGVGKLGYDTLEFGDKATIRSDIG